MKNLLTVAEAADRTRISKTLLRQQIAEGRGPAVTALGRGTQRVRVLISEDSLTAWVVGRTTPPRKHL
ncbi:helix-turn-helix transcriptional regulator [Acidisoma cladoniae]|uniref:helix-turn-helix transcriptional regulator n=1 Tax=Acidisoma cladoniae TaxID=3040935 RepID=UPI0033134480